TLSVMAACIALGHNMKRLFDCNLLLKWMRSILKIKFRHSKERKYNGEISYTG
ncbi:hypothetical protein Bpfe_012040, partial [Biomphalaria pfeifferi]